MTTAILTTKKKVDMIFQYIFSDSKNIEEENFWNKLDNKILSKLDYIKKEDTNDFDILKKRILWK